MRKFLITFAIFGGIFFAITFVLGILLSSSRDLSEYYPYMRWKEFYKQPDNSLDIIFVGSSYCYRSFIPQQIDNILHTNSFNLGSSNQSPATTYFVLKEVLKYQKPELVVMEVSYRALQQKDLYLSALHNVDFIKSIEIRNQLAFSHFSLTQLGEYIVPMYRYNAYKTALLTGKKKKIKHMIGMNVYSEYQQKGYVATYPDSLFKISEVQIRDKVTIGDFNPVQIEYLHKSISLCREKEIDILFVAHPMNPLVLKKIKDYEALTLKYENIGLIEGDNFIDMNTAPFHTMFTVADFYDEEHMFNKGANKASSLIAEELKSRYIGN